MNIEKLVEVCLSVRNEYFRAIEEECVGYSSLMLDALIATHKITTIMTEAEHAEFTKLYVELRDKQ